MNDKEYSDYVYGLAAKVDVNLGRQMSDMMHGAIGLAGESGELLDAVKRHVYYGKDLDMVNSLEECGDAVFYLTLFLRGMGLTLQDAIDSNVRKLNKRYPHGFNKSDCENRDKEAERLAIAGA